jgi:HK97 family phage major capsid protein
MTVSATHRQRLSQIRERSQAARAARAHARKAVEAARAASDTDAAVIAEGSLQSAELELETSEALERMLLSQISGLDSGHHIGGGIFEDPQTIQVLERLGTSSMPIGRVDLGPLCSREEFVSLINTGQWGQSKRSESGGHGVTIPDSLRQGVTPAAFEIIPQPRRRLSLLDIVPTSQMDGRSFSYAQETGALDDARETIEGEIKPSTSLALEEAEVVAETIPVWTKAHRNELSDVPALPLIINDRLVYVCLRRLEGQYIAGSGESPNLRGILATAGIQSVDFVAGVPVSDLVLDGITAVEDADAVPDAVVVNPVDLAQMLKATADSSGVRLDGPGAFASQPSSLWGLPTILSRLMPQGQALVGAFGTCSRLFIREPPSVRLSDSDQDDFVRNMITILAELRAGVAIWQPSAFATIRFSAASPGSAQAPRSRETPRPRGGAAA